MTKPMSVNGLATEGPVGSSIFDMLDSNPSLTIRAIAGILKPYGIYLIKKEVVLDYRIREKEVIAPLGEENEFSKEPKC